jgi:hypothetical protein
VKLRRPKPKEKRFPILQLLSKITPGPNRRRASHLLATFPAVEWKVHASMSARRESLTPDPAAGDDLAAVSADGTSAEARPTRHRYPLAPKCLPSAYRERDAAEATGKF